MRNKIFTTLGITTAFVMIAVGAFGATQATRPSAAIASTSTQITTAQNNLANCRLLAAHSSGSQRDRANACVLDQTRILLLLSPTPTPSLTATPTPSTTHPGTSSPPSTSPPTATPSTSPSITPTPTTSPVKVWPNASNTGVPAGTTLIHTSGRTITVPGTEINGEDIDGCLIIGADNVTVRNTRIRCAGWPIDTRLRKGVLIEDVEVDCLNTPGTGIAGNFTARRVNAHSCENGVSADGQDVMDFFFIHDLFEQQVPEIGHTDGVQVFVGAGAPITITNSWIENLTPDATSAIIADDHFDQLTISGNRLIANAFFPLRCPTSGSNNTITNNIISGSILNPPVQWVFCTDEQTVLGNVDGNGQPL